MPCIPDVSSRSCPTARSPSPDAAERPCSTEHRVSAFRLPRRALAAEIVARGTIDLVHGFGASVLGYARRRPSPAAPLVLNPQGLEEFGATDPSRARLKRAAYLPLRRAVIACARRADAVIATDRALEPAVRQHLGVPDDKIATIPNALDLTDVDSMAHPADGVRVREAAGIATDEMVLLSVGRLEANKGFHLLARPSLHCASIPDGWRTAGGAGLSSAPARSAGSSKCCCRSCG